ncbi:MAG: hypothetical protein E7633_06670 [Ruminococcaceae bacterium]|nr:hypothetical protein [Oscillospiraceae bacterium]
MDEFFRPYLLCSENIRAEDEFTLAKHFSLIKLKPFSSLPDAVASHADMLLCPLGDALAVHGLYYAENKDLFEKFKIKTVQANESVGKKYPSDILLNGLFLSQDLYGRIDRLSSLLTEYASEKIFVKQGYTRCSVCKINENAIITADKSIEVAASARGVDTLLISPGNILLDRYDYGFIGGASVTCRGKIFFFGNIEKHPDYLKMRDFAEKYSAELISLSSLPLCDIGGGVIYEQTHK